MSSQKFQSPSFLQGNFRTIFLNEYRYGYRFVYFLFLTAHTRCSPAEVDINSSSIEMQGVN